MILRSLLIKATPYQSFDKRLVLWGGYDE